MELTQTELETLQDLIVWLAQNRPRGFTFPPAANIIQLKLSFLLDTGERVEIQPGG